MATKKKTEDTPAVVTRNSISEKALRVVRDNHKEEYEALVEKMCAEAGIEYRRRLSQEEKDQAEFERLAAKLGHVVPVAEDSEPVEA